jgi:hypothetical protein
MRVRVPSGDGISERCIMALSDCPRCWDTPCSCGHEYYGWSRERILNQIAMMAQVFREKSGRDEDLVAAVSGKKE